MTKFDKLSANLAGGVTEMYRDFILDFKALEKSEKRGCAGALYDGPAFKGLEASSLDAIEADALQKHLRIVSGLYGLLKPRDQIQKYRLEFGYKEFDLYNTWGSKLAEEVLIDLEQQQKYRSTTGLTVTRPLIVDLASKEYSKPILSHLQGKTASLENIPSNLFVLECKFTTGGKQIMNHFKSARGMMARYLAVSGISSASTSDIEKIKNFDWRGYKYDPKRSTENCFHFDRPQPSKGDGFGPPKSSKRSHEVAQIEAKHDDVPSPFKKKMKKQNILQG